MANNLSEGDEYLVRTVLDQICNYWIETDKAIDILFDHVDNWLVESKYELVDGFLEEANPNNMTCSIIRSVLVICFPAKAYLQNYQLFFDKAEQDLLESGLTQKDVNKLFNHLY